MALLEHPAVAVALGVVMGLVVSAALFLPSARRAQTDAVQAMAFSVFGVVLSSVLGLGIIYAYSRFFPDGIGWFGVSTVVGFMVGLAVYTVSITRRKSIGKR